MKKKITLLCLFVSALLAITSCDDYETYAEKRDKENSAINEFVNGRTEIAEIIGGGAINVISETEFTNKGETTDVSRNEYVLFETSGVYMQIVNKGCGSVMKSGETSKILCRFDEYNILGDSLQLSNNYASTSYFTDEMTVTNSYGTLTGTFTNAIPNLSLMASRYGSNSVPSGWLIPLRYVKIGRPSSDTDEIAKVRIIVPSTQGQAYASSNTYACYYVLTYEKNR